MMVTTQKMRYAIIAAGLAGCLAGCHKTPNVAPVEDKEFQSTKDISYANTVISDIDMICSFVGENDLNPKFYMAGAGSATQVIPVRNPALNYLFVPFNTTTCADGKVRSGTITMYYGYTNPNAVYYHDYQFEGKVSLSNYIVDGWTVGLNNTFFITNKLSSSAYNPKTTNLSWELKGDFTLHHPTDPSRNMHCNVDLIKTLTNTGAAAVFNPSTQPAITWSLAVVEYKGTVFGETSGNVPFTYTIDATHPLVRDFSCYPNKVSGVTASPNLKVMYNEYHPFTQGVASFTTGTLYPREIAYGNELSTFGGPKGPSETLAQQCDNTGIVMIKGISYAIDFTQ